MKVVVLVDKREVERYAESAAIGREALPDPIAAVANAITVYRVCEDGVDATVAAIKEIIGWLGEDDDTFAFPRTRHQHHRRVGGSHE